MPSPTVLSGLIDMLGLGRPAMGNTTQLPIRPNIPQPAPVPSGMVARVPATQLGSLRVPAQPAPALAPMPQLEEIQVPQRERRNPRADGSPAPIVEGIPDYVRQNPSLLQRLGSSAKEYLSDEENRARLAMAFNSMRLQPDRALTAAQAMRIENIQKQKLLESQGNRTADALEAAGYPDAAKLVRENPMYAQQAAKLLFMPAMSAETRKLHERAVMAGLSVGSEGYRNFIASGGKSTVTATPEMIGTVEQGYMITRDESGNIVQVPVPGSKADVAQQKEVQASVTSARSGARVVDSINEALAIIEEAKKGQMGVTGVTGAVVGATPILKAGSTRADLEALLSTIRANIGFDRLQRMRKESPTGGALGQVAVQELLALQATMGSLDLNQSPDFLIRSLNQILQDYQTNMELLYREYSPEVLAEYGFGEADEAGSSSDPLGLFNP